MKSNIIYGLLLALFLINCSKDQQQSADSMDAIQEVEPMAPEPMEEVELSVIHEHKIDEIPLTKVPVEPTAAAEDMDYEPPHHDDIYAVLVEYDYEPVEEVQVTEAVIPLDETQTLIAYSKKDQQKAVLQVVTGPDGEVQTVMFADKNHRDIYDVQAGMTAKEAKQLRKDLKHMKHKGHHYLYDDQSNIMYLLDVQDSQGNEITEAEIDQAEVSTIIWKHKKHHPKD